MRSRAMRFLKTAFMLTAITASAVVAAPVDTVRTRIDGYRELGAAFKSVNDGLRGAQLQTILLQQSTRQIRNASRQQYGWFPAGSGAESGVKTAAKGEIWARPAQFKAAQDNFAREAEAFQKVLAGGNAGAIKLGARKLGLTCKGCHDSFRVPKD